jgi:hypothetical protein
MKKPFSLLREVKSVGLLLICFLLNILITNAQAIDVCTVTTLDESYTFDSSPYTASIDPAYLAAFEPVVLNVHYWQINAPDGSNPYPINEQLALESIAMLNIEFNQYNIFFKYRGLDEFDSPDNVQVEAVVDGECEFFWVDEDETIPLIDPDGFGQMNYCQTEALLYYAFFNDKRYFNAINIYVNYAT